VVITTTAIIGVEAFACPALEEIAPDKIGG
jgi:hypothetical protein